jgi:hypothetical protein
MVTGICHHGLIQPPRHCTLPRRHADRARPARDATDSATDWEDGEGRQVLAPARDDAPPGLQMMEAVNNGAGWRRHRAKPESPQHGDDEDDEDAQHDDAAGDISSSDLIERYTKSSPPRSATRPATQPHS